MIKMYYFKVSLFFIFVLFSELLLAEIVPGDFELLNKRRINRTDIEYTYRLNAVNNSNSAFSEVIASVKSNSFSTVVVDNTISFDIVPSNGTALSSDTFIIKQNRRFPFSKENLLFTFSSRNGSPISNAGTDQNSQIGDTVSLDGGLSSDPNRDTLSFFWKLIAVPNGSSSKLLDTSSKNPFFRPDTTGIYAVELIVSDDKLASVPSTVLISVTEPQINIPEDIQKRYGANPNLDDTDEDGLPDIFEILKTAPFHMPDNKDTDGNGVLDGDEDIDSDGLTTAEEFSLGTNPIVADSDGDELSDKEEIEIYKTNPLNPDTDGDGLIDGQEIRSRMNPLVADSDGNGLIDSLESLTSEVIVPDGIKISLKGQGFLGDSIVIQKPLGSNSRFHNAIGQIGEPIEINLSELAAGRLQNAELTLSFDPNLISSGNTEDLRIFTFDEDLKTWVPAANEQEIDTINNTVTTTVNHFSLFAIFNIKNWQETWKVEAQSCGERPLPIDMVFTLDSSGSMRSNDPNNLRLSAAKSFVNSFLEDDRGAVVDFDNSSTILQNLTNNKGALKLAIDRIDSSGGTNIGAGVSSALSILKAGSSQERGRLILLLTDGQGSYSGNLTSQAASENISIFTIGLGNSVDNSLLSSIANGTGGTFNLVRTANELPSIFRTIEIETGIAGDEDTDGDGLTDKQETEGVLDITGQLFKSDPNLVDTDGDGLTDFEEVGRPLPVEEVERVLQERGINIDLGEDTCYHDVIADPSVKDTDNDGLTDGAEVDKGDVLSNGTIGNGSSDPRLSDTDGDGLSDFIEESWSTSPRLSDTDGDGFDDAFEVSNIDDGFHPLTFTTVQSKLSYLSEFTIGALCGEICNLDTITEFIGNVSASVVPVAGTIRDVIDAIALAFKGEFIASGVTVAGVIPILGDTAAAAGKTIKFITKNIDKADEVLQVIVKADWAPASLKKQLLNEVGQQAFKQSFDLLKSKGFSDDTLLRLLRSKVGKLSDLASAVARPNAKVIKDGIFYIGSKGWQDAEIFLRQGTSIPKGFPPIPPPRNFIRFPDAVIGNIGKEAKTGFVKNTARIRTQIEKDAKLLSLGSLRDIEWHFFASGRSNSIGASKAILDLLDANGIKYIFHIP